MLVESEDTSDQIAFSNSWLKQRGLTVNLSGFVKADGASMEPTIPNGALMLVKFVVETPLQPGVYVFRHDGELFVKHLTVLENDALNRPRKILAASQNSSHPPMVLTLSDDDGFRVIGSVVSVLVDL